MRAVAERNSLDLRSPDLVEQFRERTALKVKDVRCPVHGQAPRLRFRGATLREITIQMSGCCNTLLGLANRKIANRS